MSLIAMFEKVARRYPQPETIELTEPIPYCYTHDLDLPCQQCAENKKRGYAVMQLAGRCANGSQGGHGVKWHAIMHDESNAICGATYGRRSAGWSSYEKAGQEVTCPKCIKKITSFKKNDEYGTCSNCGVGVLFSEKENHSCKIEN